MPPGPDNNIIPRGKSTSYLATDAVGQRIIPDARPPSRRRWRALQRSGRLVVAVGIVLVHSRPGVNLAAHGCGKRRRAGGLWRGGLLTTVRRSGRKAPLKRQKDALAACLELKLETALMFVLL